MKLNKLNIEKVNSIAVSNFELNGRIVPNQFIINVGTEWGNLEIFQSYETIIAVKSNGEVTLDENALEYSKTTLKYLKLFLGTSKTKSNIYKDIGSGIYKVQDLN